jgi:hypothetical protein
MSDRIIKQEGGGFVVGFFGGLALQALVILLAFAVSP